MPQTDQVVAPAGGQQRGRLWVCSGQYFEGGQGQCLIDATGDTAVGNLPDSE
ncbi:MAG: hypothetical protein ACKPJD_09690 [Planctomycetaceae bacterium]